MNNAEEINSRTSLEIQIAHSLETSLQVNNGLSSKKAPLHDAINTAAAKSPISSSTSHSIKHMIGVLAMTLGVTVPTDEEYFIIEQYLRRELGRFSPEEILLAYTLYIQDRLNVKYERTYQINVAHIERVMLEYRKIRFDNIKQHQEEKRMMTAKELEQQTINGFLKLVERYRKQGEHTDDPSWSFWHDFLMEKGLLHKATPEQREVLIKQAERRWITNLEAKKQNSNFHEAVSIGKMLKSVLAGEDLPEKRQVIPRICKEIKVEITCAGLLMKTST
jgi:hypothetical protein